MSNTKGITTDSQCHSHSHTARFVGFDTFAIITSRADQEAEDEADGLAPLDLP